MRGCVLGPRSTIEWGEQPLPMFWGDGPGGSFSGFPRVISTPWGGSLCRYLATCWPTDFPYFGGQFFYPGGERAFELAGRSIFAGENLGSGGRFCRARSGRELGGTLAPKVPISRRPKTKLLSGARVGTNSLTSVAAVSHYGQKGPERGFLDDFLA